MYLFLKNGLGAQISLVGQNAKNLIRLAEEITGSGSPIPLVIVAEDVTSSAERIVDSTIKHFGRLDVLINNAENLTQDSGNETNISDFDNIFNKSVRSFITLTALCVTHLEKTGGNVVNISSGAEIKPTQNSMNYCMARGAIDQFTKCCAKDLAKKGIRVNGINASAIKSPVFETFRLSKEKYEKMIEEYKKRYPIGRVGEVYDASAAIAYLADDVASSSLTGLLLPLVSAGIVAQ